MATLLDRKKTHFVLWRPGTAAVPNLIIGQFDAGPPPTLAGSRRPSVWARQLWWMAKSPDRRLPRGLRPVDMPP